jgi:hypothetical protein
MKNKLLIILLLLTTVAHSQTRQPFKNIGKQVKVVTLTNGEYDEFFDEDSIQRIGSALVNINTMKVVRMNLTKEEKRQLDNAKSSRFLSVDPLTKQYPELTPYQFASNSPIFAIDRDGKEMWANNFIFDIWMEWKFGDPTGAKTFTKGVEEKVAVKTSNMSYHNDNVPKNVQQRNDHINNVQANIKIAAGTAKVATFVVKTSADILSTFVPLGEGAEITYTGLRASSTTISKDAFEYIYRVQGGGSKTRFVIDEAKKSISISGNDMLFLNVGQEGRALEFAAKRGDESVILKLEINKSFTDKIRSEAVPQNLGRLNPGKPQIVDASKAPDQFGIPKEYFEGLLKNINPQNVQVISPKK